jgi:hypothetical protein
MKEVGRITVKLAPFIISLLLVMGVFMPLCTAIDTDDDGMPDDWELEYGFNPNDPSDAVADLDHDGLSNLGEYNNELGSTDPTTPFSGGRVKAVYTYTHNYPGQMTPEKITELMNHGINTFLLNNFPPYIPYENLSENNSLYDLIGPDPDLPYFIPYYWNGYQYNARVVIKEKAELAKQYGYTYIQSIPMDNAPFPNNNVISGAFPAVFSDGTVGKQISPFCEVWWQHLTKMVKSLAFLPIEYPDRYSIDGVWFDFELYSRYDEGFSAYFDETWGFEDQTFNAYLISRGLLLHPELSPGQRFNWLVDQGRITVDGRGYHQGDYYLFLSQLIKGYANTMREEVHAINPNFLIGAYPSPVGWSSDHRYYLPEIFSGWSTRTQPAVIWGTEMYGGGGADNLPSGMESHLLLQGYYNLTTYYQSNTSTGNNIYAYYLGGVVNNCYFSGIWGYHLYNLATLTNGYWVFSGDKFTDELKNFSEDNGPLPYFDRLNNTVYISEYNSSDTPCNNQETYAMGVQDYYDQMDLMDDELTSFFENYPDYQTNLTKISPPLPPTIYYEYPLHIPVPDTTIVPIQTPNGNTIELPESKIKFDGKQNFILYATENQEVKMNISGYLWSHFSDVKAGITYIVLNSQGTEIIRGTLPRPSNPLYSGYTPVPGNISFIAPSTGNYMLIINPEESAFKINSTNVPILLYKEYREPTIEEPLTNDDYIRMTDLESDWKNLVYSLYFCMKEDETSFSAHIKTRSSSGAFHVEVFKSTAEGYQLVAENDSNLTGKSLFLNVSMSSEEANQIWKLSISKSSNFSQLLGYMYVRFNDAVYPFFGLIDEPQYFMREYILPSPDPPGQGNSGSTDGSPPPFVPPMNNTNIPPQTPETPSGPTFIERGVEYTYSGLTSDSNNDTLRYRFDWGDGNISAWSTFFPSNTSVYFFHHWSMLGTYDVCVQAQDEHGANCSWSLVLEVTVSESESSGEPLVINVSLPENITTNQTILFNASGCYSLNGVIVYYMWDFGDGENATGLTAFHTYNAPGNYTVTLTVTDNNDNSVMKTVNVSIASASPGKTQEQLFSFPQLGIIFMGGAVIVLCSLFILISRRYRPISKRKNKPYSTSSYVPQSKGSDVSPAVVAPKNNKATKTSVQRTVVVASVFETKKPFVASGDVQHDVERLLSLASKYSWNSEKAWAYYHLAKLKFVEESESLDRTTIARLQKKLIESYNRL